MIVVTAVILTFQSKKSTDVFNKINKVIWDFNSTIMVFVLTSLVVYLTRTC